ncbi:sulfurtransferase [Oceanirhabdus sp. W0125-5]|uniref:sulfurtransferase n=1 Tax=Oceanirhabdus sp. W0125-5 TaxID=2999116 RepID=UPI0022F30FF6|nr:sulfurtransferase [Oceanirhabdus sp. W0125-5]WBW98860.1 sulfurtransferase [Oceanirhabdus sp. W0125-5]
MILKTKKPVVLLFALLLSLVLVGCNKTAYINSNNISEPSELKEALTQQNTVIIDARSAEEYAKGHLKGSINLTAGELTINEPVKAMLAPQEQINKVLSSKGISNDSNIFIYDNSGGVYSSRVWWTLKLYGHENVKVINNGVNAILDNDFELSLDIPSIKETNYEAKEVNSSYIATIDDVKKAIDDEDTTIIDVRSRAEFDEGAIPTAILYPHTKNLYSDGAFKSTRDTYLNYNDLGLKKDQSIILYCKSSFRATQTALLLEEAGYTNVKIYDGAWLEWSTKDMPKADKKPSTPATSQDAS